jgi:Ca-activated chloride channel family protein
MLPNIAAPGKWRGFRLDCITVALVAVVFAGVCVAAGGRQFASGVNVVEVYASVTDANGEPVTGLTAADFDVRENGEPQTVSAFAAGDFPLSAAVALDSSFSMRGAKLNQAKNAAGVFLRELRPDDQSMLVTIGSQVEIVAPLSTDRPAQLRALGRVEPFGTTGLHDAILTSIDAVQPARGRRALVLLSDGDDRYSTATAAQALERARRSDVMVYPIALGRQRPPLFVELATLTGGRSFHARDPRATNDTMRRIARELRLQYLLGYTPTRPIVAGANEWRSIRVTVKRAGAHVRARDGYQVK